MAPSAPSDGSALVLGATGGLGAALLGQLKASGAFREVHGLSRADGLDLQRPETIAPALARIPDDPPLELVIVATGVLHDGFGPERSHRALTAEHLLRDYAVNAVGPALIAAQLLPRMPRNRRTVFACLSARVGSISDNRLGGWHAYRASKAALNMLIRTLSVEHARSHPQGLVVGLHPGTVATDLSAPFRRSVPAAQLFTPEQAATHLLGVLDGLNAADSGGVFAWNGARIPE
jgi:NAD(P)-dependent dehydrogenase (short-subunit alcohol dehydrogenase family)